VKHTKFIVLFVFIFILACLVLPVAADYIGPRRTITTYTTEYHRVNCTYVGVKDYAGKGYCGCSYTVYVGYGGSCPGIDTGLFTNSACGWTSAPCNSGGLTSTGSSSSTESCSLGDTACTAHTVEHQTTLPSASVSGAVTCPITGSGGWCTSPAVLNISSSEPVSGSSILTIEGTLNGTSFACPGSSCSNIPLVEGANNFIYWAISSYGDSSEMGYSSANVDTRAPSISSSLSGTSGENGWYTAAVDLSASASDPTPGSGIASFEISLDGAAWTAFGGSLTLSDGVHSVSLRTADAAGWTASSDQTVYVDTLQPTLDASLSGTTGDGKYFTSAVVLTASGSDTGSGLNRLEYQDNGGLWTTFSGTVTFRSNKHVLLVRSVDNAGWTSDEKEFDFEIDSRGPFITFPGGWTAGQTATLKVGANRNPLESVSVSISDPKGRWPEVDHSYSASGNNFSTDLTWDGRFADGTLAPSGSYTVTILATDDAGNPSVVSTTVTVPAAAIPTATNAIGVTGASTATLAPTLISSATPAPETTSTPQSTLSATATTAGSTSFTSPTPTPTTNSGTTLPTNVLWGAAAASVIGAATAIALENARRREEEEAAQKAAAEAKAAAFNNVEAAIDEAEAARKTAVWQEQKAEEERQANLARDFHEADDASMEDYAAYQARKFREADDASMDDYAAYQAKKFKEAEAASISGAANSTVAAETSTWWNSTKEKITTFFDEKIIQPIQYFNYVMKSTPDPKGDLFGEDKITIASSSLSILGTFFDQKFFGGKASEFGKTIQTPMNIAANVISLLEGAGIQIVEDMSFGYFGKITKLNIENGSEAFLYGRNLGRIITTIGAAIGFLQGVVTTAVAVDTLLPTITGGSICAVLTGGGCLVLGAAAVAAEAAIGIVGVAETVYSGGVLRYTINNSIKVPTDKTLTYGTNKGNTGDNSKLLNENLQAAGIERPKDYAAHHLVPSTYPYESAINAREILNKFGIDINSAENGIYVSRSLNSHFNSYKYMDAVNSALEEANTKEEALEILRKIQDTIKIKGDYP
jgi:hypothetical protein